MPTLANLCFSAVAITHLLPDLGIAFAHLKAFPESPKVWRFACAFINVMLAGAGEHAGTYLGQLENVVLLSEGLHRFETTPDVVAEVLGIGCGHPSAGAGV